MQSSFEDRKSHPGLADLGFALLCAALIAAAFLATNPNCEMPFNDDFSYSLTAKNLAETGHLTYNGWATAALGLQAYWGALFIKLFGYSLTVCRMSMLPIAAASGSLAYALARKSGVKPILAVLSSLTLGLSPLFLPLATSFMTDITGVFFTLLALIAIISAGQSTTTRPAIAWMICAIIIALLGGTVRQIVWMTALAGLPCVAFQRRKEKPIIITAAIGWLIVVAGAIATTKWFAHQPYSIPEEPISFAVAAAKKHPLASLGNVWALILTLVAITLPTFIATLGARKKNFTLWQWIVAGVTFIAFLGLYSIRKHTILPITAPWIGNTITWFGVMGVTEIGPGRPPMLPGIVWLTLTFATFAALAILIADAIKRILALKSQIHFPSLTLIIFALGYCALILPRCAYNLAYDRYLLPLIPCVTIPILVANQLTISCRAMKLAGIALAIYAVFAIVITQDNLALGRARVLAIQQLQKLGVRDTEIDGGFEYIYLAHLQNAGYLNDARLINPPKSYKKDLSPTYTVVPKYRIGFKGRTAVDMVPIDVPQVDYHSFLPPFTRTLVTWRIVGETRNPKPPKPESNPNDQIRM